MRGVHWLLQGVACWLGLLLSGCPSSTVGLNIYRGPEPVPSVSVASASAQVEVQYLGGGGFLVRRDADALLFAPSFTHPSLLAMLPMVEIRSDEDLVKRCLEQKAQARLEDVEFILVGHTHYDHLLDVPPVMKRHAPQALALGSRTMRHILAGAQLAHRTLVVDECAARLEGGRGRWIYNAKRTVRVLAIESEHSHHLGGYKFMTGHYLTDRKELPRTAFGWKEGQTYAYLVDFLRPDGSVDFRIHYQDAASREGYGSVPEDVQKDYPSVDLAITCVGASGTVEAYPGPLFDRVKPRFIVLGHWEDFFEEQRCDEADEEARVVRLADVPEFVSRVERHKPPNAQWLMPYPYSRMFFPRAVSPLAAPPAQGEACPVRPGEFPRKAPPVHSALDAFPL
ncbi:MBL fold metallo-hydrolase [Stigmatella sp. ncwal1]|uniref:MBL fold metallo-hydrolase n=1 Tax=Stigmatella ashevillensis TaxID=2995309 RepID=A0ABT5DJL5_9BACT|nr:MBL fold metallo-hydrolase [Stigmatella ashevillena]MDC0713323.1 MBL fold metallo-hydrolase [Stigmatella ashevillena]